MHGFNFLQTLEMPEGKDILHILQGRCTRVYVIHGLTAKLVNVSEVRLQNYASSLCANRRVVGARYYVLSSRKRG